MIEVKSKKHAERWVRQVLEEKLREQRRYAKERLRFLAEKKKKGKLTWRDIDKAMRDVLCFKHLAFCCSVEKKCGRRDPFLGVLGLTKKDYADYKKLCEGVFWLMLAAREMI